MAGMSGTLEPAALEELIKAFTTYEEDLLHNKKQLEEAAAAYLLANNNDDISREYVVKLQPSLDTFTRIAQRVENEVIPTLQNDLKRAYDVLESTRF